MRTIKVHSKLKHKFAQDIDVGTHQLISDVTTDVPGGEDLGPSPHEFLSVALGSCTAITLKMYAEHKNWPLEDCVVTIEQENSDAGTLFRRNITLKGNIDETQRKRLLDVANHCPVHKTLTGKITIETK